MMSEEKTNKQKNQLTNCHCIITNDAESQNVNGGFIGWYDGA